MEVIQHLSKTLKINEFQEVYIDYDIIEEEGIRYTRNADGYPGSYETEIVCVTLHDKISGNSMEITDLLDWFDIPILDYI